MVMDFAVNCLLRHQKLFNDEDHACTNGFDAFPF